jgi:NADPH:quinone reductase-like Zn-dependent oxidoreductase
MAAKSPPQSIAAELTVPERLLLFCPASDTDWQAASITHATAQHMMVRIWSSAIKGPRAS